MGVIYLPVSLKTYTAGHGDYREEATLSRGVPAFKTEHEARLWIEENDQSLEVAVLSMAEVN